MVRLAGPEIILILRLLPLLEITVTLKVSSLSYPDQFPWPSMLTMLGEFFTHKSFYRYYEKKNEITKRAKQESSSSGKVYNTLYYTYTSSMFLF